jgi:hypothetical protein
MTHLSETHDLMRMVFCAMSLAEPGKRIMFENMADLDRAIIHAKNCMPDWAQGLIQVYDGVLGQHVTLTPEILNLGISSLLVEPEYSHYCIDISPYAAQEISSRIDSGTGGPRLPETLIKIGKELIAGLKLPH